MLHSLQAYVALLIFLIPSIQCLLYKKFCSFISNDFLFLLLAKAKADNFGSPPEGGQFIELKMWGFGGSPKASSIQEVSIFMLVYFPAPSICQNYPETVLLLSYLSLQIWWSWLCLFACLPFQFGARCLPCDSNSLTTPGNPGYF